MTHGIVQGGFAELQGGDFGSSFLSGFTGSIAGSMITAKSGDESFFGAKNDGGKYLARRTVAAAVVGGTTSEIAGGKFANGAATAAMVHLLNHEGGGSRIREGTGKWKARSLQQDANQGFLSRVGSSVKNGVDTLKRAFDFKKIGELSDTAFANESIDAFAHERSAYQYGEYVGNPHVVRAMRIAGETGQFLRYGLETVSDYIGFDVDILLGSYNPFSIEYLSDAAFDVQITVDGARGSDFNESIKR